MDIRDYVRIFRQRWLWVIGSVLVAVGLAALTTFTATPQYASSTRLYVSTTQDNAEGLYSGGMASAQRVTSYAELATSRELALTVKDELGLAETPDELAQKVSADVLPETVILTLTARDPVASRAQQIAQTYAEQLVDMVSQLETLPGEDSAPIKATVIDPASVPGSPVTPQPVRNFGLAVALGLLVGLLLSLLRELFDTTITTTEAVNELSGAPTLGMIAFDNSARTSPLITSLDSHAPRVESFRVLRTNIQFIDVDTPDKVFVVTSALPGEGKTTTSVNLALTLAQAGQRTLLVECDLRRPRAAATLDLDNAIGVTTVLLGKVSADDAIQKHVGSDLHVLGSGPIPPNPAELLQSHAMKDLLTELRARYDLVIIDAPPLLPVTDAALLAAQSDGAILIVRHGKTTRDQVAQARNRLTQVDAKLVGTVLNMARQSRGRYGYGYGYGYGYAPDEPGTSNASGKRSSV